VAAADVDNLEADDAQRPSNDLESDRPNAAVPARSPDFPQQRSEVALGRKTRFILFGVVALSTVNAMVVAALLSFAYMAVSGGLNFAGAVQGIIEDCKVDVDGDTGDISC